MTKCVHNNILGLPIPCDVIFDCGVHEELPPVVNSFQPVSLMIKGQGVVVFKLTDSGIIHIKFNIENSPASMKPGETLAEVNFYVERRGGSVSTRVEMTGKHIKPLQDTFPQVFIDEEKEIPYWISLLSAPEGFGRDKSGVFFKFGYGEVRRGLSQLFRYLRLVWSDDSNDRLINPTIKEVQLGQNLKLVRLQRDPVVRGTPLLVIPPDEYTIEDADLGTRCVPSSLTPECQKLYDLVTGKSFVLNTPDFPDFTTAIEYSIHDPNGWCYKLLQEKAKTALDKNETHIYITAGRYQGESPGIPYAFMIWPPGHYSPIHDHSKANSIIRVLYGGIRIGLFAMLSPYHKKPFLEHDFYQDQVTWASPTLNQTHQLHNVNQYGPTCITAHVFRYSQKDLVHYKFSGELTPDGVEKSLEVGDETFSRFKKIIKEEWEAHKTPIDIPGDCPSQNGGIKEDDEERDIPVELPFPTW
eukprot:g5123.t1